MLEVVGLAVVLFASTNIDDVFVLLGFLADRRFRPGHVIIGQYVGIAALFAVSVVASLVSLVFAPEHVGFLGLLPILIGIKKLFDLWRHTDEKGAEYHGSGTGNVLAVGSATVANGGNNIGVYVPVFATHTALEIGIIAAVFVVLIAVWIGFAYWLVNHQTLGMPIRRYGHIVTPFVLIALGVLILHKAGSLRPLFG